MVSRAGTVSGRVRPDAGRGLDQAAVRARVAAGQVNAAPPAPGRTVPQILRANVLTRFNAILGALFVVVMIVGPVQDALFGAVLAVNTALGVLQELRAKRTLDRLAILTAPRARVVREGAVTEIPADQVVLDDVLELRPGDQVVVDAEVARASGLELDEALLTGEAEPVPKAPGARVLSGSLVVAGTGRVMAAEVGESAYAARLEAQARRFSLARSELRRGTNDILRAVTWVMVPAAALLIASQLLRSGQSLPDAIRGTVGGVSAMVPEGLVLLTSIAFALGALRLARRQVLVQELVAIEGLARVDVLCIDKTGTLTEPGMAVVEIVPAGEPGPGAGPAGDAGPHGWPERLIEEAAGAVAAADPAPNATMRALTDRFAMPPAWSVTAQVPFSSQKKWSSVSFAGRGTWVLGAPGIVAAGWPAGVAAPVLAAAGSRERAGRRVLLLCHADQEAAAGAEPSEPASAELVAGLTPVALLVLAERLRADARQTVRYQLDQGISIVVLSGDAPGTVAAIAGQAGIPLRGPALDASGLPDDAPVAGAAAGRVRPGQKLATVRSLREAGHVVAMLGDGVNDIQALKQADLGIAMGSGSQASRSVAQVVLLDDSFAMIPRLLAEGRRVIASIERVANLFVTKTVYAAVLAVVVGIAGIPFPFFPRHLTIISTLTVGVPGFFLALAPGAPRARPGFVRRTAAFTIPVGVAAALATLGSYAIARSVPGVTPAQARTTAVLALAAVALWVLGLIARPLNPARTLLIAAMAAGVAGALAVPLTRMIFGLAPPPPPAVAAAAAAATIAVIGALTLWRYLAGAAARRGRGPGANVPGPAAGEGEGS